MEFYAGNAECTKSMRRSGIRGVRFDIGYFDKGCPKNRRCKSNFHDILSDSGFLQLVLTLHAFAFPPFFSFSLFSAFLCLFALKVGSDVYDPFEQPRNKQERA